METAIAMLYKGESGLSFWPAQINCCDAVRRPEGSLDVLTGTNA